jgi:hypothetical protein
MLTLFRTNQPFANIFLLFYLAIVRASTFVHPSQEIPHNQGVLSQWMYAELSPVGLLANIISFLLIFFQAVFINIMVAKYRVATELSLLPGLFYCLIASFLPDFMTLSPILLANTFLILAMFHLYDVYKNNTPAAQIFDVGLWIGVASLFYFSYTLFFLWGIVGLGLLRGLRLKELLMYLIGFIVPYFLFGVFLFWNDSLPALWNHFAQNLGIFSFAKYSSPTLYLKIGAMGLLILTLLFMSSSIFGKRNIAAQKYVSILYWMLIAAAATILIQRQLDLMHLTIVAVPVGILLSMLFQRATIAMAEVLHMLLLVVALILQFEFLLAV